MQMIMLLCAATKQVVVAKSGKKWCWSHGFLRHGHRHGQGQCSYKKYLLGSFSTESLKHNDSVGIFYSLYAVPFTGT
jgi:hypothetical protein